MLTLAVAQTKSCCDINSNIETLIRICENAAAVGCVAVCFPEAFLTGYQPDNAHLIAIERGSVPINAVKEVAKRFGIDILTGFFERTDDSIFITHGIFRPDGSTDFYRKTHLGEKESRIFSCGESLDVFTLSCGLKIGFQLCVETHFSRISETLSLNGAQVIFAPHAVPCASGGREKIWSKYIPARSYDNRIYFACCNHADERFGGGCMVAAPNGDVIASYFGSEEALLAFDADDELLKKYRMPNSSHRFRYYPQLLKKELCE